MTTIEMIHPTLHFLAIECLCLYYVQANRAKFRMISDIDLSDGWEGPIWISKSDKAKMPNFEYVASNGRGQIFLCTVIVASIYFYISSRPFIIAIIL